MERVGFGPRFAGTTILVGGTIGFRNDYQDLLELKI